jgi:outer membrane protein assembly factor BamB/predicted DNA-binding WGR domain protein
MTEIKTYLELSEDTGSAHKFYEVIVNDTDVTIRYGRIGDAGQSKTTSYPTAEQATTEATKKLNEKQRKGYAAAVAGVRQKRTVTRRSMVSYPAPTSSSGSGSRSKSKPPAIPPSNPAPVLWQFASGASAFGIFIDRDRCWVGNENGQIFALTPAGEVLQQFKLPDGVKCIVADDNWLYAGCDDGKIYDLTGKVPRVAYEIAADIDIYWIDIADGILGVSDANGNVTTINHEEESRWKQKSKGSSGWMVRCDEIGVYHGHSAGVTMYDWEDGRMLWDQKTDGVVLFGWQEESAVYVGTSDQRVYSFSKTGVAGQIYQCDGAIYSCATAADGKYVFAGDGSNNIYCFDDKGDRLWKLATGCGSAFSMQFLDDRLYIVTTNGTLACIDASAAAIESAQAGTVPTVVNIKSPKLAAILPSATLETTNSTDQGVIVQCIQEGTNLRVRVVSEGYNPTWNVQFPKDLRTVGSRYVVDEVKESDRGGFYRAYGDIKKLLI